MTCAEELSAMLRRSSQSSLNRVLLILYALEVRGAAVAEAGGEMSGDLSLTSVCLILRYAFPGRPPRFLFTLAESGSLYRSPDRGVSWRVVYSAGSEERAATSGDTGGKAETAAADARLAEILQLLPQSSAEERTETRECEARAAPAGTCLACDGDTVVLGGRRGLLAVSVDRGLHFHHPPARLWDAFSAGGGPVDLSSVAVAGADTLLLTAGKKVVSVVVRSSANGTASFGACREVLTCKGRVCSLTTVPAAGAGTHVVVCEAGKLHLSIDGGQCFIDIPHKLGFIRSLTPLASVRNAQASAVQVSCGAATLLSGSTMRGTYEYAVVLRKPFPSTAFSPAATAEAQHEQCPQNGEDSRRQLREAMKGSGFVAHGAPGEEIFCQTYLATGVGTEILPYDYSCLLTIGVQVTQTDLAVVSQATSVSYTPFVRSTVAEPIPCAGVSSCGSPVVVAVRGGGGGVSVSLDGGATWSVPRKATPVALIPVDGGDVVLCSRRSTVTIMDAASGVTRTSHPVTGDFRQPVSIAAAAACL